MSKSSYKEAIEILVNMGNSQILEVIKALKQAQKQEKLLNQIKDIINKPYNPNIMPMFEKPERYNEIVKLIKELENE